MQDRTAEVQLQELERVATANRTLYEQLVTADKVDLLMGPYATGAILSAMGVAQRYGKVLVNHTLGVPSLAAWATPAVAAAAVGVAGAIWRLAVRHHRSTGS